MRVENQQLWGLVGDIRGGIKAIWVMTHKIKLMKTLLIS